MEICKKETCTGCFACVNACPNNCIEMKEDEFGYIYPVINEEKCVHCNLCKRTCPQLNQIKSNNIIKAYAIASKNDCNRKSSTSGGAASVFYENVLKDDGVCYGVSNIDNNSFNFTRITNVDEIEKLRGSKYVHAYINNQYKNVKEDLMNNKKVLFIGTPCQIAGLSGYLKHEYENLITVDLVCHGVPPQKFLREQLKIYGEEKIGKILFRKGNKYVFEIYNQKGELITKDNSVDYYKEGFLSELFYRENCYNCRYAQKERVSDITIGDFWGLDSNSKLYDTKSIGVSLVLINTEKGLAFFDSCKDDIVFEEHDIEEAIKENKQLHHASIKNNKYEYFRQQYLKTNFAFACKRSRTIKQRIKNNKLFNILYRKLKEGKDE